MSLFSKMTGIKYDAVSAWYDMKCMPSTEHLAAISSAFKISIDDLVRSDITRDPFPRLKKKYLIIQQLLNL